MAKGQRTVHESAVHPSDAITEIAGLLSVLGNPSRLGILFKLKQEPCGFGTLLEGTGLKKSALANQLRLLQEKGLLEKVSHGSYKITEAGKTYLQAILDAYTECEEKKRLAEEGRQREEVARAFLERR